MSSLPSSGDKTRAPATIEQRVTRLCLGLSFGVLLAFSVFMVGAQALLTHERVSEQLQEISMIVARSSSAALAFGSSADAAEILQSMEGSQWLANITIYDAQARLFTSYRGSATACLPALTTPEGLSFTWCGARWAQPINLHGQMIGSVSTVVGLEMFWAVLAKTILASLAAMAVLMAGAMILARRIARRMTTHLSALASTAEQVAHRHDFELRARVGGAPEIRAVAQAFNVMLDQLAARDDRLRHLSNVDALTGLNNRRAYEEWLVRSVREARVRGSRCVLIYLDLDGFKAVNDGYGHAAGDTVLRVVADRLRKSVRQSDFCCRLGGDEFAVVLGDQQALTAAAQLAEKICRKLAEPYTHDEALLPRISASLGIAVFPEVADDVDELMRRADQAMYRAKAAGRNQVKFFTAGREDPAAVAGSAQPAGAQH